MPIRSVKEMVAEAKAETTSYDVAEARAKHEAGDILLVDIRDPRELARDGRIPGAMHAPRGMLEFWVDPASPYHKEALATEKPVVLFCASSWRSALSAKTLKDMGMDNIAEMEGGFSAWRDAGAPIDKDST